MIARALLVAFWLCWPFAAAADVAVPPLSGRVVDQTGTLSASDAAALTQRLKDLETRINTIQALQNSRVGPVELMRTIGNMVNKTLTMIKGPLPNRFYSICQNDRMRGGSGT